MLGQRSHETPGSTNAPSMMTAGADGRNCIVGWSLTDAIPYFSIDYRSAPCLRLLQRRAPTSKAASQVFRQLLHGACMPLAHQHKPATRGRVCTECSEPTHGRIAHRWFVGQSDVMTTVQCADRLNRSARNDEPLPKRCCQATTANSRSMTIQRLRCLPRWPVAR